MRTTKMNNEMSAGEKNDAEGSGIEKIRPVRVLIVAAVMLWQAGLPVRAQNADTLTLRQAVTLALQNSRELAMARVLKRLRSEVISARISTQVPERHIRADILPFQEAGCLLFSM
jgi:hypothetical protein